MYHSCTITVNLPAQIENVYIYDVKKKRKRENSLEFPMIDVRCNVVRNKFKIPRGLNVVLFVVFFVKLKFAHIILKREYSC